MRKEGEGRGRKRVRVCPAHSALLSSLSLLSLFLSRVQEVLWYAKNGPTTRLECAASHNSILLFSKLCEFSSQS